MLRLCLLVYVMYVMSLLSTMVSMRLKVYLSLYTLLRSHLFVNCCIRRYSLYMETHDAGRRGGAFPGNLLKTNFDLEVFKLTNFEFRGRHCWDNC